MIQEDELILDELTPQARQELRKILEKKRVEFVKLAKDTHVKIMAASYDKGENIIQGLFKDVLPADPVDEEKLFNVFKEIDNKLDHRRKIKKEKLPGSGFFNKITQKKVVKDIRFKDEYLTVAAWITETVSKGRELYQIGGKLYDEILANFVSALRHNAKELDRQKEVSAGNSNSAVQVHKSHWDKIESYYTVMTSGQAKNLLIEQQRSQTAKLFHTAYSAREALFLGEVFLVLRMISILLVTAASKFK